MPSPSYWWLGITHMESRNLNRSRPERPADLLVDVTLIKAAAGNPQTHFWQGCRFPNDFGLNGELNDGQFEFSEAPPGPGETASAELWLLSPDQNFGRFYESFEFTIWHGYNVATGKIVKVLNKLLSRDTVA